jgi:hypothetical protein
MNGDWNKPYVNDIPPLLEEGVRVLIYAGDGALYLFLFALICS